MAGFATLAGCRCSSKLLITARIRASMDPEAILRTAVRELGMALGVDRARVQLRAGSASETASSATIDAGDGGSPEP